MKRILDLIIASRALLVLPPIKTVITSLAAANLGLPLLFKELSPSLNGNIP